MGKREIDNMHMTEPPSDGTEAVSIAQKPAAHAGNEAQRRRRKELLDAMGLSTYIAWSFIFWNSPNLFGHGYEEFSTTVPMIWQGFATAAAALVVALLASHLTTARRRYTLFGILAMLSVVAVAIAVSARIDATSSAIISAAFAVSGIGSSLRIGWEERISFGGVKSVARVVAIAYVIGYLIFVGVSLLPTGALIAIAFVLPVAAFLMLALSEKRFGVDQRVYRAAPRDLKVLFSSIPLRYIVVIALAFFGYGATRTSGVMGGYLSQGGIQATLIAGAPMIASIAGIGLAFVFYRRNIRLAFYIAIPLMAAAAMIPSAMDPFQGGTVFFAMMIGSELIKYVIWFIFIDSITKDAVSALFCLALIRCAQWAGSALGQAVSGLFAVQQDLVIALLLALIIALLLVMGLPVGQDARESSEPDTDAVTSDKVAVAAKRFGLSPREAEVLAIWAAGYSSPYIEKKLFISKSTVKTHLGHIYAKTGTANREQLLELMRSL